MFINSNLQAQSKELKGVITDHKTKETLPYATVSFRNFNIGVVADRDGWYTLNIPQALLKDTITVSYIGYKNFSFVVGKLQNKDIQLIPDVVQLDEVVVRPISAEEFIRRVIRNIPKNYMDVPFQTLSFYRRHFEEENVPIDYTEGIFSSYQRPYLTDSANQHQLALHRVLASDEMQFRREKTQKAKNKARKKAAKKGEEFDENGSFGPIVINFAGPEGVLKRDPVRSLSTFLDSAHLNKYAFSFHDVTTYNDREVEIINFKSKGKAKQVKTNGRLFIDRSSLAIIKIEQKGEYAISLPLKAALYAMGFSLNEGLITRDIKYKSFHDRWYPENITSTVSINVTNHNMFGKNETAHLDVEQIFSTMRVRTEDVSPIESLKQYDNSKDMEDQVYQIEGVNWDIIE